jgi:hypothetical protein
MRRLALTVLALVLIACSSPGADDATPESDEDASLPTDAGGGMESGVITFETNLNERTLRVRGERDTFSVGQPIAWSVQSRRASGRHHGSSRDRRDPGRRIALQQEIDVSNPDFDILANRLRLGRLLDGPGQYVMRYINLDGEVLAEGSFRLRR